MSIACFKRRRGQRSTSTKRDKHTCGCRTRGSTRAANSLSAGSSVRVECSSTWPWIPQAVHRTCCRRACTGRAGRRAFGSARASPAFLERPV
eukprot:3163106-Pleurochrysis_carterae.AAC.6